MVKCEVYIDVPFQSMSLTLCLCLQYPGLEIVQGSSDLRGDCRLWHSLELWGPSRQAGPLFLFDDTILATSPCAKRT